MDSSEDTVDIGTDGIEMEDDELDSDYHCVSGCGGYHKAPIGPGCPFLQRSIGHFMRKDKELSGDEEQRIRQELQGLKAEAACLRREGRFLNLQGELESLKLSMADLRKDMHLTNGKNCAAGNCKPAEHTTLVQGSTASSSLSVKQLIADIPDDDDEPGPKWFREYLRPCVAEFFVVMVFVMVGTMAAASNPNPIGVATAHGFTIALMAASFGSISGGHINPAVTIGVCLGGGLHPVKAVLYIISQLIGSMAGAGIVRAALSYQPEFAPNGELNTMNLTMYGLIEGGAHTVPAGVPVGLAVIAEIGFTMVLVMTVLMTAVNTDGKMAVHPLVIGFAVLVGILASMKVSGASMNPARSFGPAVLITGVKTGKPSVWTNHWVYWAGPVGGAFVAGAFYRLIFGRPDKRLIFKED